MKAVVAAFDQEKALVGAFSVIHDQEEDRTGKIMNHTTTHHLCSLNGLSYDH